MRILDEAQKRHEEVMGNKGLKTVFQKKLWIRTGLSKSAELVKLDCMPTQDLEVIQNDHNDHMKDEIGQDP